MRVFLVGFMGAGKTSVGRALARQAQTLFFDLDERLEAVFGARVAAIFARQGEAAFRAEEARQLAKLGRFADVVVATGGGTFVSEANRATIRRLGVSVHLKVSWGEVLRRLPGKRAERPLFSSPEQAHRLYLERLPAYRHADITVRPVEGETPEVLAARIALLLRGKA